MDRYKQNGNREGWIELREKDTQAENMYMQISGNGRRWGNCYYANGCGPYNFLGKSQPPYIKSHRTGKFDRWIHILLYSPIDPGRKWVKRLRQLFAISCLMGIFVDPLFFFVFYVKKDLFCIAFDSSLAILITILRSLIDLFYLLHMVLQFRLPYIVPGSDTVGAGELVYDPKLIARHYLGGWFLFDLFSVLPVPQIVVWIIIRGIASGVSYANFAKSALRVTVLIQYIPRCIRSMPFILSNVIFETAKANFLINLFVYLLAGHVVGCCWYLFGLQRVNQCIIDICMRDPTCNKSFLDCGTGETIVPDMMKSDWFNNTKAQTACIYLKGSFDFGIYASAADLSIDSTKFFTKYIYSLFWGVMQVSTLAGNLVPSKFVWEVMFTLSIVLVGLILLALLIGNMQNFLESLGSRKMDMQLKRNAMETWMARRNLPLSLRRRIREAERFKWAATRGIDEDKIIEELPEDMQKDIHNFLYSKYLRKVYFFSALDDIIFEQICEKLHPRLYIQGSIILRNHYPVERMLFILRGNLESIGEDGYRFSIKEGDFCGEELLSLFDENISSKARVSKHIVRRANQKAISSRMVKCLTNVEAFSLEAEDLEYVTKYFSRNFRQRRFQGAIRYQSPYWRSWAAAQIQVAWKYYVKKKLTQKLHEERGLQKINEEYY